MDGPVECDHIVRLVDGGDPFDLGNLQTLCVPCHKQKEREYVASRLVRNPWINPRYPELNGIAGMEEKESEYEEPVF